MTRYDLLWTLIVAYRFCSNFRGSREFDDFFALDAAAVAAVDSALLNACIAVLYWLVMCATSVGRHYRSKLSVIISYLVNTTYCLYSASEKSRRLFRLFRRPLSIKLSALSEHVGKEDDRPWDIGDETEGKKEGIDGEENARTGVSSPNSVKDHIALAGDAQWVEHEEGVVSQPFESWRDSGWVALLLRHQVSSVVVVSDHLGNTPGNMNSDVGVGRIATGLWKQRPNTINDQQSRGDLHGGGKKRRADGTRRRVVDLHNRQRLDGGRPEVGQAEGCVEVSKDD